MRSDLLYAARLLFILCHLPLGMSSSSLLSSPLCPLCCCWVTSVSPRDSSSGSISSKSLCVGCSLAMWSKLSKFDPFCDIMFVMDEPDAKDASLSRTNSGSPAVQWLSEFGRSPVDLACSSAHSLMACPTRANCVSIVCRWISVLACVFN
ncbi:unnamed protein product [Meganyctiphanes norvegica]|uniref:Secreted protein n=1 Tax=Meganyctiphanes norvegica TaxID=48144 RepID=A0AAV2SGJ2_MEGNR